MRFRLKAFLLHLGASAAAMSLLLGALYLGWYHWPGWYLTGVVHVLWIVPIVDLFIGPTLTLLIASPKKPRRELARDVAMIAVVQVIALGYGAQTLWQGRPMYYTYSSDRLELVQASDLETAEVMRARRENPQLAPHWYSGVRWVWAALPDDPEEATKIVQDTVLGKGQDVIDMPRYFRPWPEGLPKLRENLQAVGDIKYVNKKGREALAVRLAQMGLSATERNAMIMWGNGKPLVAIFDLKSSQIRAIVNPY
jgi:hypothetical protein